MFFYNALWNSSAFTDSYWVKIKRDFQYQLEEVLDWVIHLKYFQIILKEFNPAMAPNNNTLIRYFWEELYLSIWAQLDNRGQDLDVWEVVVEKVINVEAKASV